MFVSLFLHEWPFGHLGGLMELCWVGIRFFGHLFWFWNRTRSTKQAAKGTWFLLLWHGVHAQHLWLRTVILVFILLFFSHLLLILVLHQLVNRSWVFDELLVHHHLIISIGILSHHSTPVLGVSLGLSSISASGHVGWLLDGILTKNIVVGLLLNLSSIVRHLLKLSDYSDTLAAVQSFVCDLGLERECLDFSQINIFHFNQLWDLF